MQHLPHISIPLRGEVSLSTLSPRLLRIMRAQPVHTLDGPVTFTVRPRHYASSEKPTREAPLDVADLIPSHYSAI